MDILFEEVAEEPFFLYGVHADFMNWIRDGSAVVQRGLLAKKTEDLIKCLALRNIADRRLKCIEIVKELWGSFPILGPYPLLDRLALFERKGKFYQEYRDHASHQLLVYLLGLFLYDKCEVIRTAVQAEIGETYKGLDIEEEFIRRWLIAALMHDIGYTMEGVANPHEKGEDDPDWIEVRDGFMEAIEYPLSCTEYFRSRGLLKEEEGRLYSHMAKPTYHIGLPQDIGRVVHPDELTSLKDFKAECHPKVTLTFGKDGADLLELVNLEAAATGLGKNVAESKPLLRRYLEVALQNKPIKQSRNGFFDHGIMSASILLRVWTTYRARLHRIDDALTRNPDECSEIAYCMSQIQETKSKLPASETIRAAAAAIALHNVNKEIWEKHGEAFAVQKLPIGNFRIDLQGSDGNGHKAIPLAFLLALADTLQDWDRPKFRPRLDRDREFEMADADLSIQQITDSGQEQIGLYFRRDRRFSDRERIRKLEEADALYVVMAKRLRGFMNEADIQRVLNLSETPPEFSVKPGPTTHGRVIILPRDGKRPRGKGTRGPRFVKLTDEDVERIGTLTGGVPRKRTVDVAIFEQCQNNPDAKQKPCTRPALSLRLLAELRRCAEAAQKTSKVLHSLNHLYAHHRAISALLNAPGYSLSFALENHLGRLCQAILEVCQHAERPLKPATGTDSNTNALGRLCQEIDKVCHHAVDPSKLATGTDGNTDALGRLCQKIREVCQCAVDSSKPPAGTESSTGALCRLYQEIREVRQSAADSSTPPAGTESSTGPLDRLCQEICAVCRRAVMGALLEFLIRRSRGKDRWTGDAKALVVHLSYIDEKWGLSAGGQAYLDIYAKDRTLRDRFDAMAGCLSDVISHLEDVLTMRTVDTWRIVSNAFHDPPHDVRFNLEEVEHHYRTAISNMPHLLEACPELSVWDEGEPG